MDTERTGFICGDGDAGPSFTGFYAQEAWPLPRFPKKSLGCVHISLDIN